MSGSDCTVIHEDVVREVEKKMPQDRQLLELAELFKVFGDHTRVRILWALSNHEMCVCDLAVLLNLTKSAVSHQLRVLKQSRLVRYRKEGRTVYYSPDDDHIRRIFEQGMEHVCE